MADGIQQDQYESRQGNGTPPLVLNYAQGPANGPPMVLLHGLTARWQVLLPLIPALSQTWQVYAPDFRGHGKSGRAPGAYRGEDYSADIIAFLRERVKEPAVLFGHSLGGMVALYVAATHPDLVRALIMADNPISIASLTRSHYPALFGGVLRLMQAEFSYDQFVHCLGEVRVKVPGQDFSIQLRDIPGNDPAFMRFWARSLSQMDPDTLRMLLDGSAVAGWEGTGLLPRVQCPTMVMQASPELGGLMSNEDAQSALASIRGAIHVRFDGLGHPLYIHDSAPVLRALLNFLGSL